MDRRVDAKDSHRNHRCRFGLALNLGSWLFCRGLFWGTALGLVPSNELWARPRVVGNGSFETPQIAFVEIGIRSWEKSRRPEGYVEEGGYLWNQLTGLFKNTLAGSFDHIENCDSNQCAWLFAVPEVGLSQLSTNSSEGQGSQFEVGKSYRLTAGVIGSGGGMSNGVTLDLRLFYRDAASNHIAVAVTTVTNSNELFGDRTRLFDYRVSVPSVKPTDLWAGQPVGIEFFSTVEASMQGGYWVLDHVRLEEIGAPVLSGAVRREDGFQFQIESEPGLQLEIWSGSEVPVSMPGWSIVDTITNTTGSYSYRDVRAPGGRRYYQAREAP